MPADGVGAATPGIADASIAEIITVLCAETMQDIGIPGEPTQAMLSWAIDTGREDTMCYDDQLFRDLMVAPEVASFCRPTAARLFEMFRAEAVEHSFEYAAPESLPTQERGKQVFLAAVRLAREVRKLVLDGSRAVYRIKYANHEFVVTVRSQRAELFQSFQFRYGVGAGIEYAKSFGDGEVEFCLATMAQGGEAAHDAQTAAFGYVLAGPVVFGYERAGLATDDQIVQRLRERMQSTLTFYEEVSQRLGSTKSGA